MVPPVSPSATSPPAAMSSPTASSPSLTPSSSGYKQYHSENIDPRSYSSPSPKMSPERPKNSPLSPPAGSAAAAAAATALPVASRPAPSPPIATTVVSPPAGATRSSQRAVEISPPMNNQPSGKYPHNVYFLKSKNNINIMIHVFKC